jgi:lipid II:glycine glycyltransferase (peptidoglycan interpeptide bridge formation enzyme)
MSTTIDVACRSEWDEFLATSRPDIGFKQSTWWAEFLRVNNWGHFGVVLRDGSEIVGGAIVLKRRFASGRCFYYLPQGPVLPANEADAEAAFAAIMSHIDDRRRSESRLVSHLRIEPRWKSRPAFVQGCREARSWREPRVTLFVDLAESEEAILAQMKQKGRYNIRVAMRSGVSVVEDTSVAGLHDFFAIYRETMDRHGLSAHPFQYFQDLRDRLVGLDCGTLMFAEYQGQRVATVLVIYHGDTASFKFGASVQEHRSVMAPYLLHFEAMRAAKARRLRWYDFCGIARTDDPADDWAGFTAFKHKFGGQVQNFIPALEFIYDQDAYQEYRRRS